MRRNWHRRPNTSISLLPERLSGEVTTDWLFIPSVELGGDAFGYHWLDPDHLAMYLLDVCGHGVTGGAAVHLGDQRPAQSDAARHRLPLADRGARRDSTRSFQMDRHNDMYFTMWYGVYDKQKRRLTYANGGHPPPILMAGSTRGDRRADRTIAARNNHRRFPGDGVQAEDSRDLPAFSRLYVFSDGIYEVTKPDDTMLTYEEFMDILTDSSRNAGSALEHTIGALRLVRGGDQFEDDVSIIEFAF